jgi:hypothetical protein
MATTQSTLPRAPAVVRLLEELELPPAAVAALVAGWAIVWLAWLVIRFNPLAGVSATACWLAAVVTFLAWRDLLRLTRRWHAGDYHSERMHLRYHWWLAPAALGAGILLAYWKW